MPCFYHPDRGTEVFCSDCGRQVCQECTFDLGNKVLCPSCCEGEARLEISGAKKRLEKSWVVAACCGALGMFGTFRGISDPNGGVLLVAMLVAFAAYTGWSVYLVMPTVWNWWQKLFGNVGSFPDAPVGLALLRAAAFFVVPMIACCYYGIFGGGIYTYLKTRRIARSVL